MALADANNRTPAAQTTFRHQLPLCSTQRFSLARLWTDVLARMNGNSITERHEQRQSLSAAHEWFEALDQRAIGQGHAKWVASVLRVHGDDCDWWIDVATTANPAANVVLRVSRQATVFHAVAALRRHRPRTESCAPVIDVMPVC